ncbi:MAG: Peptidase domain protein [Acidobacteria bacterium]|nr:Peptidase domain protein [Acidobacteriota bacterium]
MKTTQKFPRKAFWCLIAIALICGCLTWQFGVGAQSRRSTSVAPKVPEIAARTSRQRVGQSTAQSAMETARAHVDQAIANEKANPTKQAALDVDAAWLEYNNATAARVVEIQMNLRALESSSKTAATAAQMESLEAEMRQIASSPLGPTPDLTPETEPNNSAATANALNLASQPCAIVTGSINPGGDLDFFTFTAAAGSRVWIETDTGGTQNAGATSRDTVIDLLAADGTTVIENDDDDGTGNGGDGTIETGLASMIGGRTLTTGGTYFIRVRAFSATAIINPYRMFVVLTNSAATPEVEANNSAATANPAGLTSGSIGVAGDVDYYSITAAAGNIIYFNTDADPERDGTGTDLVVELRDPADVLLLSVDSSITGSLANPAAEGANFTVTTSGTYFIKVRHFSATGTGTYHLMVSACSGSSPIPTVSPETEPNDTSATANLLDLSACGIVSASINPGGDIDFFKFTGAPAGSRIWIETDTGGTQNAGATSRDTVIDLLAADGTTVIENDDDDGTGNGGDGTIETGLASMIGGRTLTAGGTYFIRVRAFSATGIVNPYRLFVRLTNVAATPEVESNNTAATANVGGLNSGAIGAAGDVDDYSVAAVAGNVVYFNVDADPERDGTGTDLVVEFRDPSDVLLLSVDSSITGSLANPAAEGANFTIATSGTYFIKVRHFSATGTGTYHLLVSACSGGGGPAGCTLTCPANVTQPNDVNQCGAVVTYPAPTTSGSCGTVNCSPASGSFFPVGTTTVTCTPTTGSSCTFTVTVQDTQPPNITCPANVTTQNAPGQNGAVVNYPAPTVSDNCPAPPAPVCSPASGSFFPVGVTTVTCTVGGGGGCTNKTITHSTSQAITPLNSVSCNDGVGHTDNSYWRAFSLPAFSITNIFHVTSVDVGIETASATAAPIPLRPKGPSGISRHSARQAGRAGNAPKGVGTQPATVRVYRQTAGSFPSGFPGSLSLLGTSNFNVTDQAATIINVPITADVPAGSELVVEVFTPDGTATGSLIFIGSNSAPETGPSYLSAADCGISTPTTTAALGFPDMHIVMNVHGCEDNGGGLGANCTFTVTVKPPRYWSTTGSTGTSDEDSTAIVSHDDFAAQLKDGVTGTATVRYNITATRGISGYCPATQSVVNVRFRNSDNTGTHAQVKFEIHRTNILTGGNDIIYAFNSNGVGAGSSFTSLSAAPSIDFDFSNYVYWIEGTIFRDQAAQFADLGDIQIYESAGTPCP